MRNTVILYLYHTLQYFTTPIHCETTPYLYLAQLDLTVTAPNHVILYLCFTRQRYTLPSPKCHIMLPNQRFTVPGNITPYLNRTLLRQTVPLLDIIALHLTELDRYNTSYRHTLPLPNETTLYLRPTVPYNT